MQKMIRVAAVVAVSAMMIPVAGCAGKHAKSDTGHVARDVDSLDPLAKR